MQLTQYTDYALRTLVYLALKSETSTITEISDRYNISRNHLVKVVHGLGKLGYIQTIQGRNGGIVLAYAAVDINIGDVIRKTEPNFHIVQCFDAQNDRCTISAGCQLKGALGEAFRAFMDVLDNYTLAQVVENAAELKGFLQIAIPQKDVSPTS